MEHEKTCNGRNGGENVWPPRAPRPFARACALLALAAVIVAPLACSPWTQSQSAGGTPARHAAGTAATHESETPATHAGKMPATQPASALATSAPASAPAAKAALDELVEVRATLTRYLIDGWHRRLNRVETGEEICVWADEAVFKMDSPAEFAGRELIVHVDRRYSNCQMMNESTKSAGHRFTFRIKRKFLVGEIRFPDGSKGAYQASDPSDLNDLKQIPTTQPSTQPASASATKAALDEMVDVRATLTRYAFAARQEQDLAYDDAGREVSVWNDEAVFKIESPAEFAGRDLFVLVYPKSDNRQMKHVSALSEGHRFTFRMLRKFLVGKIRLPDGKTEEIQPSDPNDLHDLKRVPTTRVTADSDAESADREIRQMLVRLSKKLLAAQTERQAVRAEVQQQLVEMLQAGGRQRHSAMIIIRDADAQAREVVVTPKLLDAVAAELSKMLAQKAKNWEEGFSRCVACQVLGRYPDRDFVPVLLKALEDPFVHHEMTSDPDGIGEHHYDAVWWDADDALRAITRCSPMEQPLRQLMPEEKDRLCVLASWTKWWKENDFVPLRDSRIGKWRYLVVLRPASSRSRARIGELSFDGKALNASGDKAFMWTPWGKLVWLKPSRPFANGWLAHFEEGKEAKLVEAPSPDPETSKLVRRQWEAMTQAAKDGLFRVDMTVVDKQRRLGLRFYQQRSGALSTPNENLWLIKLSPEKATRLIDRLALDGVPAMAYDPALAKEVEWKSPWCIITFAGEEKRNLRMRFAADNLALTLFRGVTADFDGEDQKQIGQFIDKFGKIVAQATSVPAGEPATQAADEDKPIEKVSSLARLRALAPVDKKNDWELRLGWAESGIDGAPWKLFYAHLKYVGEDRAKLTPMPDWGFYSGERTLGPVGWELRYARPGRMIMKRDPDLVKRIGPQEPYRMSTERVYCAVVQTPLAGTYKITAGRKNIASVTFEIKKLPQLGWFALFNRPARRVKVAVADGLPPMAMDALLAAPKYNEKAVFCRGNGKEYTDETELFSRSLPGQCPGMIGWRSSEGHSELLRKGEPQTPFRMDAAVADGKLVISCYKFTPGRTERQFLVRWRINGNVATAHRLPDLKMEAVTGHLEKVRDKAINDVTTIQAAFVLPRWLATRVKEGDEVSMELLYTPHGWEELCKPGEHMLRLDESFGEFIGHCTQPVLAKPATFRVTKEMLDQSGRS